MSAAGDEDAAGSGPTRWLEVADAAALRQAACRRILDAATLAIERRGRFLVVLAGGETPRGLYRMLREASSDWPRWEVFFGDERCLPAADPERNSAMAADAWLDHVPIARGRVHAIPAQDGAGPGARAYARTLQGVGEFDLVLLGLGEDGHTASLFPGHDWGTEPDSPDALAVLDAPKPPLQRVSLSAARLGRARGVLFLVAGQSKRDAVRRWRAGEDLPARAIRPASGVDVMVEAALLREALPSQA
jgi:6-phosphogluconolactonase